MLTSFAPWIVFWILIGNVDFRLAMLVALAIAALHAFREARATGNVKVLDVGTAVAFAVLLALTWVLDEDFLERWMQALGNGALFAIALASVLIGKPFVLAYAKEDAPPEIWNEPLFLRTVNVITWVWIAAFAVMTVSAAVPPLVDPAATLRDENATLATVFYWVIPAIALAGAILFTKRYPEHVSRAAGS
ncbi:MAG TPA: hypothetical protein VIS07_21440 [Candidatus Binatia bacterium]